MHILIEVKHFTSIHFNVDKMCEVLSKEMGNTIYVQNTLPGKTQAGLDKIRHFIRKEEVAFLLERAEFLEPA
jgi:hypothetical protein